MAGIAEFAKAFQAGPGVDQGRMFERLTNMMPQDMPLPQRLELIQMLQTRRPEPVMQDRLLAQLSREFDEQDAIRKRRNK